MIDQDFSTTDHAVDAQNVSNYHFVNENDISSSEDQKLPLKASFDQFSDSHLVYQPSLALFPANAQSYSADTQLPPYDGGIYHSANVAAVGVTANSQAFYSSNKEPIARTASDASEHSSSTAEGLSEVLGALKIDETGTGSCSSFPFDSIKD